MPAAVCKCPRRLTLAWLCSMDQVVVMRGSWNPSSTGALWLSKHIDPCRRNSMSPCSVIVPPSHLNQSRPRKLSASLLYRHSAAEWLDQCTTLRERTWNWSGRLKHDFFIFFLFWDATSCTLPPFFWSYYFFLFCKQRLQGFSIKRGERK